MTNLVKQRGVTLIEMVVTIVILSIALVTISFMLSGGLSKNANVLLETRAITLGQAYLDEISGRRFDEQSARNGLTPCFSSIGTRPCTNVINFGPDAGENTRRRFDDVDDYHGLQEGLGFASPITDADGNTRSGYENYSVEVSVRYGGTDAIIALADSSHAKLITVNINHGSGEINNWQFSVYKGNY